MYRTATFLIVFAMLAACSTFDESDTLFTDATLESDAGVVQTSFPSDDDPGPPFYARIAPMPPFVFADDDYAAIVFYRNPDEVPATFDLLTFFDFPVDPPDPNAGPGAFGAAINVQGTNFWNDGNMTVPPRMSHSRELGLVPVWFVPTGAVMAKIDEGAGLFMTDLVDMNPLVGAADHLREVLHPHPLPPEFGGGGGHPVAKLNLTARGQLDDGRRFDVSINATDIKWNTRIRFR